jgi:septation ring formation regulator EzrA
MDQELVQYLEERFDRQEQRFNARFDAMTARFDRVEQRLDSHDERFGSIDQRFDELKRHTGVLVEGLRHEVQLVAEGFATFVEGRYAQDQAKIDRQFQETHALIRSSYDHLQQQQDQTRQRVENLERKSPN